MNLGRSIWTRGVLALGVGALFLLGWGIELDGDESSGSASTRISELGIDAISAPVDRLAVSSRDSRKRESRSLNDGPITTGDEVTWPGDRRTGSGTDPTTGPASARRPKPRDGPQDESRPEANFSMRMRSPGEH